MLFFIKQLSIRYDIISIMIGKPKSLQEIKEILNQHKEQLRLKYKITDIAVFGSYVRGESKSGSDIDILADFEEIVSLFTLGGAQAYLTEILDMKVDLVPKDDIRPELKEIIIKEAVHV